MLIPNDHIIFFAEQARVYSFFITVLASLIGGDIAVFILAFLAGQEILPFSEVILGGFLGMFLLDAFWFATPRSSWGKKLRERGVQFQKYRALEAKIESFSHKSDILILFISKVLVGTRILTLVYLSLRTLSFRRFLIYNALATFPWVVILGLTGWFVGLGHSTLDHAYHSITVGALYLTLAGAIFYCALWLIRQWIARK